jgi:hypothetical protein
MYFWGNTGTMAIGANDQTDGCGGGLRTASFILSGRDYFNGTPKPGYAKYTYPHPLRSGTGPGTGAPTNLQMTGTIPGLEFLGVLLPGVVSEGSALWTASCLSATPIRRHSSFVGLGRDDDLRPPCASAYLSSSEVCLNDCHQECCVSVTSPVPVKRHFTSTDPKRSSSPSVSGDGVARRSPRRSVPFSLPKSSIVASVPETRIRA